MQNDYIRSDLAAETFSEPVTGHGISYSEFSDRGIGISDLRIMTDEGSSILGKPKGHYITVGIGRIWEAEDNEFRIAGEVLSKEIGGILRSSVPDLTSVLVAGLGNRYVTPDAVGPLTVKGINVTRHIRQSDPVLFSGLGMLSVSAVAPGVVGQTGVETAELIESACRTVRPSAVIVIDALAARSVERLATTVQITDTGIEPGSGIGSRRSAINAEKLGVPVLSLGIPTVVDSSTLVYDMLEKAGVGKISDSFRAELDKGRDFFVSLNESDVAVTELARLLSTALNSVFTV